MDMIAYKPFAILGALIAIMFLALYLIQKKDHEQSARELQEYLHRWQIESDKNDKNAQRILDEIQQTNQKSQIILEKIQETNKDNALFLRMIFERVDKPQPE